ncbi:alpha/beta fold hydrolase [Streptomyces silvensis]|uniref:alpha/beta fold hydrolase n=1 Tax=Streptomyces silvensis TaxID=1765722 RepID=UPI00099EB724|nr:alpha/beta fold hydrolase [Streptomyces silvensis]
MPTTQLSNGVQLAYDDHAGPETSTPGPLVPLVLVHGHPFNRSSWDAQVAAFAAERRVITFDLRGYGASAAQDTPLVTDFGDFARDLMALLDHLGVERCALGGVSMGGQIALDTYARFPDRIAGLLLADTSPRAETPEGKVTRNELADRLLAEGMRGYTEEVLYKMVAPYNEEAAVKVQRMMLASSPDGAAAALRARAERPDYEAGLAEVAVPVLVVVGRDDVYTPVAGARALHEALPDSRLCVVERAGHLPNLERPEEFNAAVRDWLARLG